MVQSSLLYPDAVFLYIKPFFFVLALLIYTWMFTDKLGTEKVTFALDENASEPKLQ